MGTEWICVVYLLRIPYLCKRCNVNKIFAFSIRRLSQDGVYSRAAFPIPRSTFEICHLLAFLLSLCFTATVKRIPEEVIITPFIRVVFISCIVLVLILVGSY